jgi:Metallo-beta-lactamase superfamily
MPRAPEIEPVVPGLFLWRFYDPSIKADLFATALETASGLYLIDPIPLATQAMEQLATRATVAGVIVTNENHERAAAEFARVFRVPIYLNARLNDATNLPGVKNDFPAELSAVEIEGAPTGEVAVHLGEGDGTMVIGDALINFEPYGFALLPAKYCADAKLMRRSLAKLLDYSFERMLFAHGLPILTGARKRLEQLLHEHR